MENVILDTIDLNGNLEDFANVFFFKSDHPTRQCSKHLSMPLNGFLVTEKGDNSLRQHFLRQSRLTNLKRSCRKYFHSFNYLSSANTSFSLPFFRFCYCFCFLLIHQYVFRNAQCVDNFQRYLQEKETKKEETKEKREEKKKKSSAWTYLRNK